MADVKLAIDNIQDWIASIPLGSHILRDQENDSLETLENEGGDRQ